MPCEFVFAHYKFWRPYPVRFRFADGLRPDEPTFRCRRQRSGFGCIPTFGVRHCWSQSDHGLNPLTDNDVYSVSERAETAVVLLVALVLITSCFFCPTSFCGLLGRQGAAVLTRVMGIILSALAVEFILTGLSIGSWAKLLH